MRHRLILSFFKTTSERWNDFIESAIIVFATSRRNNDVRLTIEQELGADVFLMAR